MVLNMLLCIWADFLLEVSGRKNIQSLTLAWSILHPEIKGYGLPPLEMNNSKGRKMHTKTQFR